MSAYLHLTDVRISKYQENPQVKFTEDKNDTGRGTLRFKISNKRRRKEGTEWVDAYDNYTIEYRCKGDSKQIPLFDIPGIRVAIRGEILQEEYEKNKYCKVRADYIQIVKIPENVEATTPSPQSDDVPF